MNKYLLLRDNKQSGPYTADELATKGLKPYDLVWLEGKSAAWRYPSEIEDLKAFAPVVEEQPFDRFYKKTDPVEKTDHLQESKNTDHSRFEPKPVIKTVPAPSKKVYINFPGATKIEEPRYAQEPKEPKESLQSTAYAKPEKKNNTFLYAGIAAALIAIIFISYLTISYNKQRQDIHQLNTLIQQLEQNQKQDNVVAAGNIIENREMQQQPAENIAPPTVEDKAAVEQPKPSVPVNEKPANKKPVTNNDIVFKESKQEPIIAADEPQDPAKQTPGSENLFKLVSVKLNDYKVGVLGGISNLQLELTNNSLQELHKVAVEIKYLGPEKRVVRKQTVYFENIAPGAQSILDIPKSNRGVSVDYAITNIKS